VRGGRAYAGARIGDLLELGVLVDRAARPGPGKARELNVNNDAGEEPAGRSTA
jgi:hypothetical protein